MTTDSISSPLPASALFDRAIKDNTQQRLSRPSLSYWQDAWMRLKKNGQAITSLVLVISLLLFATVFQVFWRVDPSEQDLSRISEGPRFSPKVLVAPDLAPFEELLDPNLSDTPAVVEGGPPVDAMELSAPTGFALMTPASTQGVRLKWNAVPQASGYSLSRADRDPKVTGVLGSPLAEIQGTNKISYEDTFGIEPRKYWYTLTPMLDGTTSNHSATLVVEIPKAISLTEALLINPQASVGQTINLASHPLGTDYLGRDLLSRLMHGGAVSLGIGIFAPLLSTLFGMFYGGLSGFVGGRVDHWLMRFADFVLALPFLLFVILIKITFGAGAGESGIGAMVFALVALSWTTTARLTRGQVLQLRETEFVQAAKLLGGKPFYLLVRHMLPNTLGIILVSLTFEIPRAIFTEAFLSFIGMGVVPPTPSWGTMCNDGIKVVLTHPHEFFFPALIISITVLAFNLLGDGLRDALDPRMRSVQ